MAEGAIPSVSEREENGRWITPPKSPGRPKGCRNKLGEAFLEDLLADWSTNGKAAIATVRADKPDAYLKVVASILPRELNVKVSDLDELTDDQLQRQLASIVTQLAATGLDLIQGAATPAGPEQAGDVPTLQ